MGLLAFAGTATAGERGYAGDDDPWVLAGGPTVRRRGAAGGDTTALGGGVRLGRAWGVVELRTGLELSGGRAGELTASAGAVIMPLTFGRASLGVEAEAAAYTRSSEQTTGMLTRLGLIVAYRPFASALQPICHGCAPRNVHVPVQLEVVPLELDLIRGDGARLGAVARIAIRW